MSPVILWTFTITSPHLILLELSHHPHPSVHAKYEYNYKGIRWSGSKVLNFPHVPKFLPNCTCFALQRCSTDYRGQYALFQNDRDSDSGEWFYAVVNGHTHITSLNNDDLLPPERDPSVSLRLRYSKVYPITLVRSKRYCSFINYSLKYYQ